MTATNLDAVGDPVLLRGALDVLIVPDGWETEVAARHDNEWAITLVVDRLTIELWFCRKAGYDPCWWWTAESREAHNQFWTSGAVEADLTAQDALADALAEFAHRGL